MDPLPPMHRRGLILAALLVVMGFLLPATDTTSITPTSAPREAQIELPSSTTTQQTAPEQTPPPVVSEPQQTTTFSEPLQQQPVQQQQPAPPRTGRSPRLAVLSSSGALIALKKGKHWRNCSATITCRQRMCMQWQKWRVTVNRSAHCKAARW